MKRKRSSGYYKVFYCAAIIVAAVFMTEFMLRNIPYFKDKKEEQGWDRALVYYDSILGWKFLPDGNVNCVTSEYNVNYKTNSKGLRDKEYDYDKPRGKFRIVCLGDSVTFGWGVSAEERFTEILENKFRNVEVINMGVPAYGVDQMLLFLKREGVKYNPDLVIVYLIHEDLRRVFYSTFGGAPKPLFGLCGDNKLALLNVPLRRGTAVSNSMINRIKYNFMKKSYIFYYLCIVKDKIDMMASGIKISVNKDDRPRLIEAIFKDMKMTSLSVNAKLQIVGSMPEEIRKFFIKNDIYFMDDPLSMYKGGADKIFYPKDRHPNAYGQRLIAEGMYDFCVKNSLMPGYKKSWEKFYEY